VEPQTEGHISHSLLEYGKDLPKRKGALYGGEDSTRGPPGEEAVRVSGEGGGGAKWGREVSEAVLSATFLNSGNKGLLRLRSPF